MCGGGTPRFAASAVERGWKYGARLPGTPYAPVYFADQDWRKPDRARYIAALEEHRPEVATVLDLEHPAQFDEVMTWAEDASRIVRTVVIIPKVLGMIDIIPEIIGSANVVLGYSVPTKHGGTIVPLWEFGRRPVHLLGGSPQKQMELALYLNVVSADGNMAIKMSHRACFWRKKKGLRGHWVQLGEIGRGDEKDAPYKAFDLSMGNIKEAWEGLQ